MAIHHAAPGEVIEVRPSGNTLASSKTTTLIKTPHAEVLHMVLPAGKVISEHKAPGEITIQCLDGRVSFSTMGKELELEAGQLLYLNANEPHSVHAVEDSSLLLTILLPRK